MTLRFAVSPCILFLALTWQAVPADARLADVVGVSCRMESGGTFLFDVTVAHSDDGWGHFADIWQVLGPDGVVLGERILAHPHDTEQPFTRSQSGIKIPSDINNVTVRAHDKSHGWGGQEITIDRSHCSGG